MSDIFIFAAERVSYSNVRSDAQDADQRKQQRFIFFSQNKQIKRLTINVVNSNLASNIMPSACLF
jgi:hypothetical protein